MPQSRFYPVGIPGVPWRDSDRADWLQGQKRQRSYAELVESPIENLRGRFEVLSYGQLDYAPYTYSLHALLNASWQQGLPAVLITGGVHGYETSGVLGALEFAALHAEAYAGLVNLLVVPCVSPWAFEHMQRWNPLAVDPNRSFGPGKPDPRSAEAVALMRLLEPLGGQIRLHVDLHETTDTDESEFRPALAARDGQPFVPGSIPDGFYLVADTRKPCPDLQKAIIKAVSAVTHIAPADRQGNIIGSPVIDQGVISYDFRELGLCAGISDAPFRTTTEVYPDSARITARDCIRAQVVAVRAAIDYMLSQ